MFKQTAIDSVFQESEWSVIKCNSTAERDVIGQQEILVDGNPRNVISLCFQFASKIEDFGGIGVHDNCGDS